MSIRVTIKSRKLGREVTFVAREGSGYVFRDPNAATWGHQVFSGATAAIAKTEADLRRIARRWIASQEVVR